MKTITQFVQQGINNRSELQEALQTAMRLEFSTLPPYLCAEWSISGNDLDGVAVMIHEIVLQEMFHFALAGNMLSAIGGTFKVADPQFLPSYPTHTLPGDIHQDLTVDLRPLSKEQLQVFMQIENSRISARSGCCRPRAWTGNHRGVLHYAVEGIREPKSIDRSKCSFCHKGSRGLPDQVDHRRTKRD